MYSKEEFIKAVGSNIRRLREERRISMESFAFELGIEYRQLGRIERGEINTTVYMVYRISNALKVKPSEILEIIE